MAKFSSTVTTVTIDASPGGAAKIITPYVDTINGMAIEAITQQTNPFGVTSEQNTPTGLVKSMDLTLAGLYDNVADVGSWTVLKQVAGDIAVASVGRVLIVLAATGATYTITVHLVKTEVIVTNGSLTRYATLLRPATVGVWS